MCSNPKESKILLQYHNLEITQEELDRTNDGKLFNCLLIDFYMTYLQKHCPQTMEHFSSNNSQYYIFNCAFYRILTEKMQQFSKKNRKSKHRRRDIFEETTKLEGGGKLQNLFCPLVGLLKVFEDCFPVPFFKRNLPNETDSAPVPNSEICAPKSRMHHIKETKKRKQERPSLTPSSFEVIPNSPNSADASMRDDISSKKVAVVSSNSIQKPSQKKKEKIDTTPLCHIHPELFEDMTYFAARSPKRISGVPNHEQISILSKKYVLIPVNISNYHWILVIIRNLNNFMKVFEQSSKKSEKKQKLPNCESPAILVLDSLGNNLHPEILEEIRCYLNFRLQYEFPNLFPDVKDSINSIADIFTEETLPGYSCNLPRQSGVDCGVFVVTYAQKFLENLIDDIPINNPNWFVQSEIPKKRREIRNLILEESKKFGKQQ